MPKGLSILLLVGLLIGVFVLPAGAAASGATTTRFSGTGYATGVSELGEWTYPGRNTHIRGMQYTYQKSLSDPRVSGTIIITVYMNARPTDSPQYVQGPFRGTFRLENPGGYWEGTVTGGNDQQGFAHTRFVGRGGGGYEGLHLTMLGERPSADIFATSTDWGWILDPGS